MKRHQGAVTSVAVFPGSSHCISCSIDGKGILWDLKREEFERRLFSQEEASWAAVAVTSSSPTLGVSGLGRQVHKWNLENATDEGELYLAKRVVSCLTICPRNKFVAIAIHTEIVLVDLETRRKELTLNSHGDSVSCIAFGPGNELVSGSYDRKVILWQFNREAPDRHEFCRQGQPRKFEGHGSEVRCVAMSPDGKWVVSGSKSNTIRVWNVNAKRQEGEAISAHKGCVYCVAVLPDCQRFISGGEDGVIRAWHLTNKSLMHTLNGHTGSVMSVAILGSGPRLVSSSTDASIKIWKITDQADENDVTTERCKSALAKLKVDNRFGDSVRRALRNARRPTA